MPRGFHLIVLLRRILALFLNRKQLLSDNMLFEQKEPSGQKCIKKNTLFVCMLFGSLVRIFFTCTFSFDTALYVCFYDVYLYVPIVWKWVICASCVSQRRHLTSFQLIVLTGFLFLTLMWGDWSVLLCKGVSDEWKDWLQMKEMLLLHPNVDESNRLLTFEHV